MGLPTGTKKRILVVDASEVWRKILIGYLEEIPGIEVVGEISSNQGAILMLDELSPDLVMLDANPHDHMLLLKVISQFHSINPQVRIILCADSNRKENIIAGMGDEGVVDFMVKPYKKSDIVRVIHERIGL